MTTLTFPDIKPTTVRWSLVSNTQSFTSPLTNTTQTLELPGSRWMAVLTFNDLSQDDARTMASFLTQLRGQAGRFYLYDHSLPTPRGDAGGTPLVNGASQTGTSLITDGWDTGVTNIMREGDYFEVNDELKMITSDVNSDVGGNATLTFEPPLRASPSDNAVITVTQATAIMRLVDDGQAEWSTRSPLFSSFSITAIESFTA